VKKLSISFIAFIQALGVFLYCGSVSLLFWKGNEWFGVVPNYFGPLLFLTLLVLSVLACGLIVFGYPIKLFWIKNEKNDAIKLLVQTALWLLFFVGFVLTIVLTSS